MARRRAKSPDLGWFCLAVLLGLIWLVAQAIVKTGEFAKAYPFVAVAIAAGMVVLFIKIVVPAWKRARAQEQRKRALVHWWLTLDGYGLERETARLYSMLGYTAVRKGGAGDEGVDLMLKDAQGESWIVQCKSYAKPVGPRVVRDLYGTLVHERAQGAILVAPGGFSEAARRWASGKPIQLLDASALVQLSDSISSR